jgi:hypothetical protein
MKQKLDPRLLAKLEQSTSEAEVVDVLVALDIPLTPALRQDLQQRGLALRTDAGTVLTGSLALNEVFQLAGSPHILMIELSGPLYSEGRRHIESCCTE